MISVSLKRDAAGRLRRVRVEGHSELAPAGQDLLCAAVSAITQTAALGVRQFSPDSRVTIREDGFLELELSGHQASESLQAVVETMLLGLKDLRRDFPEQLKIEEAQG